MRKLPWLVTSALFLCGCVIHHAPQNNKTLNPALLPPDPPREFRAVWVATVGNIDWPSRPGLSLAEQRAEMMAILDKAKSLNLNAVIFQVRDACDSIYDSRIEPWSYYLTAEQGKPPALAYDPLKDWIAEAHLRGLELHAWFNPFRARTAIEKSGAPPYLLAPWHVANMMPDIVKKYGSYLWLDPGEPAARKYTLAVMADVVKRYDVDGIHIDDYFYPYKEKGPDGKELDFPDDASWGRYQSSGGKLSRDDWRRDNINQLVHQMYSQTKAIKPWVKVGISPFGIWRPGNPPSVRGFDSYAQIYCDSRLWANEGWADYFSPQLYWKLQGGQPYEDLLNWWLSQNTKGRHIWPGIYTSRIPKQWDSKVILDQIAIDRKTPKDSGEVHFSMIALMKDAGGIDEALKDGPYSYPALVPASPWLGNKLPASPKFEIDSRDDGVSIKWKTQKYPPFLYLVQAKYGDKWRTMIYNGEVRCEILRERPDAVSVRAVDRLGNLSEKREATQVK